MSMFRKASPAIMPAPVEPVADEVVTHGFEQIEPVLPTSEPDKTAIQGSAQPKPQRAGSKGAALLSLLQREEGASLDEMIERTGWQGHTVRAAMTGLRKKGHGIDKRTSGNSTVWFIAAEPAA